jgi:hypothetical protein
MPRRGEFKLSSRTKNKEIVYEKYYNEHQLSKAAISLFVVILLALVSLMTVNSPTHAGRTSCLQAL